MRVLLGVGGSEDADAALATVVERTRETGDELTVAVVDDPASEATPDEVEAHVRETVADAGLPLADDDGDGVVVRRLEGEPGPQLVTLAERDGFDRLVVGGGSRSPMGKIQLGELVEYVLLNARVTVTLVR